MTARPLLDRLHDLEAALRIDKWHHFALDVRQAIEELQRRERLLRSVDVDVSNVRALRGDLS